MESGKLLRASAHLQIGALVAYAGGSAMAILLRPEDPVDVSLATLGGAVLGGLGLGLTIGSIANKAKAGRLLQRAALKQ